jgi:hypothetical protein
MVSLFPVSLSSALFPLAEGEEHIDNDNWQANNQQHDD